MKWLQCLIKGHEKVSEFKSNLWFDNFEWISCERCGKALNGIYIKTK